MKFANECLTSVKSEMIPLLHLHWSETEPNQDEIKLDPDWAEYFRLSEAGILQIFTARDNKRLIGYCVVMISKSIHHKDHIFAATDVVYIHPEFRKSATGSDLIQFAENYCNDNGASLMTLNMKTTHPFDKLMLSLGFNLLERVYHKCFVGK